MKIFTSVFLASLTLLLSLASPVFSLDATQAVRLNVTPKSPIPTGTVATWPLDASVPPGWLVCNGQAVPSAYPELRALMGSVPNYNSQQFLRGSTSGAGRTVADSTRSHMHTVPQHSHTVSGTASSQSVSVGGQSVSGTAAGQTYLDTTYRWDQVWETVGMPSVEHGSLQTTYSYIYPPMVQSHQASSSSITGTTAYRTFATGGGSINGYTNMSGNNTDSTGGAETAPQHTLVKFIIKHD